MPSYRELRDALDALETVARRSTGKIIAAIPAEHITAIVARVERAKDFLIKLDAKLGRDKNASKTCAADHAMRLTKLLQEARKTDIKKYGRHDYARILEAIWSELNPAQIALLRSGQYGPAIKATADARERE
jgi:hypothetical protein